MGLDAAVRCRCWEEGKTTACPFPDLIAVGTDLDQLELNLPWEGNEEKHWRFDRWRISCCAHHGMWLVNERIGNWSGIRDFQQALRSVGAARFATLLAQIPNNNGGRTSVEVAKSCLAELDAFASLGAFGRQIWLIDAETGDRVHNHIEAYDGVFIQSGKGEHIDIGIDARGLFVRRPEGDELFRSMSFEQIKHGEHEFALRDLATSKQILSSVGIQNLRVAETDSPRYPRRLMVEETTNHAQEYRYIVERLRTVFEAAVAADHPASWY
jgi:hypothetical protein